MRAAGSDWSSGPLGAEPADDETPLACRGSCGQHVLSLILWHQAVFKPKTVREKKATTFRLVSREALKAAPSSGGTH